MPQLGSTALLELGIHNQTTPKDGPRAIPVRVDFTVEQSWELDLSLQNSMAVMKNVQSFFVDNSNNAEPLSIFVSTLQQTIIIPPLSQGYVPILATTPAKLILNTTGGVVVQFQFMNVPMPLHIWGVGSSTFQVDANGFVQVSDPALEAAIANGGMNVNYLANARRPQDFAVRPFAITTAASTTLMTVDAASLAYIERFVLSVGPTATRAVAGLTTMSLRYAAVNIWQASIWVPAAAGTGPGPLYDIDLSDMDFTAPATGSVTLVFDTAFNGGTIHAQLWGGLKAI